MHTLRFSLLGIESMYGCKRTEREHNEAIGHRNRNTKR
jgi:hypothetical protein